ncbi:MAG: dienelactone hydrolase family protein [Pseudolabrys sp.]
MWLLLAAGPAMAGEQVEIPSGDVKLRAMLYRPDGPGPFPAVVALHACDGLGEGLAHGEAPIEQRYQEWGERLKAAGFAVLFPDSFGSRGLGSQCTARQRMVRASRTRINDANAARHWLQVQPFIIGDRVSLLGWSHGATSTLWTVRRSAALLRDKSHDFRSAVALYPNCQRSGSLAWSARIPTLILIGRNDDWTLAATCEAMVTNARGRSAGAQIVVYPHARHDFDRANLHLTERRDIANAANTRVHIATDPAARADVFRRVPEWFAR